MRANKDPASATSGAATGSAPLHSASAIPTHILAPSARPSVSSSGSSSAAPPAKDFVGITTWADKRVVFSFGSKLMVLDSEGGPRVEIEPKLGPIRTFAVSSKTIAVATEDGTVSLFAPSGAALGTLPVTFDGLAAMTFSRDEMQLATLDKNIRLFDIASRKVLNDITLVDAQDFGSIVLHEDRHHVLIVEGATVYTYDFTTGKEDGDPIATTTGLTAPTVISPDGRFVAAGNDAGHIVQLWRTLPPRPAGTFGTSADCANHVGMSFGKDILRAYAGRLWEKHVELKSFSTIRTFRPKATVVSSTLTDDGKFALIEDPANAVKLVDPTTYVVKTTFPDLLTGFSLRPDGAYLAGQPVDGTGTPLAAVNVYNAKTGTLVASWKK